MSLVYLMLRLYLAYVWLSQSLHKVGDPKWMATGEAVRSFWERAVAVPKPPAQPAIAFGWYRAFLRRLIDARAHRWLAPLLVLSMFAIGVSLVLGLLVRPAALAGLLLNLSYSLAGGKGHNPFMLVAGTMLLFAPTQHQRRHPWPR